MKNSEVTMARRASVNFASRQSSERTPAWTELVVTSIGSVPHLIPQALRGAQAALLGGVLGPGGVPLLISATPPHAGYTRFRLALRT